MCAWRRQAAGASNHPTTTSATRRGWGCWLSLALTLLMLATALACGGLFLYTLGHHSM